LLQPCKDRSITVLRVAPKDVKCVWNKAPGIWFPRRVGQAAKPYIRNADTAPLRIKRWCAGHRSRCARSEDLYEARLDPREGDERLSAKKRSESEGAAHSTRSKKPHKPDKDARKQRSTDLGRALRSIYDDTLRESVPGDFTDLIGKLS
jgi:hypothetical protein